MYRPNKNALEIKEHYGVCLVLRDLQHGIRTGE